MKVPRVTIFKFEMSIDGIHIAAFEMRKLQRFSRAVQENMRFKMSMEINGDSLIFNCVM